MFFLSPVEISEKPEVFWCFLGAWKENISQGTAKTYWDIFLCINFPLSKISVDDKDKVLNEFLRFYQSIISSKTNLTKRTKDISMTAMLPYEPSKRQPHEMIKHTQTIYRQIADELFECVWPFCGFAV